MLVPLHTAHAPYAAGAKELPGWHCLLQHVSGDSNKVTKRHESLGPPAPLTAAANSDRETPAAASWRDLLDVFSFKDFQAPVLAGSAVRCRSKVSKI